MYVTSVTFSNGPQCGNVYECGKGPHPKQMPYNASNICTIRGGEKHAGENKRHNQETPRIHHRFVPSCLNISSHSIIYFSLNMLSVKC